MAKAEKVTMAISPKPKVISGSQVEYMNVMIWERDVEIKRLRKSVVALIEVYAPPERNSVLRNEHLAGTR